MKYTPRTVGLLQAAGLVLYVCFFAFMVLTFDSVAANFQIEPSPILGITLFLLSFIISAVICGSLFLAYPVILFFRNEKNIAYRIIIWNIGWLVIFFLVFLLSIALISIR